jgi:hypothetical protein
MVNRYLIIVRLFIPSKKRLDIIIIIIIIIINTLMIINLVRFQVHHIHVRINIMICSKLLCIYFVVNSFV